MFLCIVKYDSDSSIWYDYGSMENCPPTQTLTQIQGDLLGTILYWAISRGGIFRSWWQFYRGQFSGHDLNSAFQTKINATSSVE